MRVVLIYEYVCVFAVTAVEEEPVIQVQEEVKGKYYFLSAGRSSFDSCFLNVLTRVLSL